MKGLIISCILVVLSVVLQAQERVQVTGVVTNEDKEPIPGVSVVIKRHCDRNGYGC